MKQRGFAPILILLVVLLIGGAYYFGKVKKDKAPIVSVSPSPVGMSLVDITKKYRAKDYVGKLVNNDGAVQSVEYKNEAYGISFDVPYNPNWGIGVIHPLPYDESYDPGKDLTVYFGPIYANCLEGDLNCNEWGRVYKMRTSPLITKEARLSELKKTFNGVIPLLFQYRVVKINNLTVIMSIERGEGDSYRYEVFGNKYIYTFITERGDDELFTKIIESIKLLD